jgi:hypothetical protein
MQRKACNTHKAADWLDLVFAHSNKCTTACAEVERSRAMKEFILPPVMGSTSSYFSVIPRALERFRREARAASVA